MERTKLENLINEMTDDEIIELHNNYCMACSNYDDCINPMWYLDDDYQDKTPTEIVDECKDINTNDSYYQKGVYGAVSFNNPWDYVFESDIIYYILRSGNDLENDEIRKLFHEDEEDESEE